MRRWQALSTHEISSVVKQARDFKFYSVDVPITDENIELAELGKNVQMTAYFSKEFAGYIFTTTLLYMGWENGNIVFYTARGGEA